jgi:hypothetical protein
MFTDRRVTFIQKWLDRARNTQDPFDCFFSGWIALVVAAQRVRDYSGRSIEEDSDRQRIVDYFRYKKSAIVRVLRSKKAEMRLLASRQGTRYRNPIVDTGNAQLCDLFSRLSRYHLEATPMPEEDRLLAVAELLNRFRNNVFHGIKVYDDGNDISLLEVIKSHFA